MRERILVTGGTGVLGRLVVERLLDTRFEVRLMSRKPGPVDHRPRGEWTRADLRSGQGVDEALAGVDVVVHCATAFSRAGEADLARTLIKASTRAGCPHLVYISIVGVDRVPLGYYQGKLAAERLIEHSGSPYTILRSTQFHDLLRAIFAGAAKAPVMLVPDLRFQPIDASEVANRLVELALGEPAGRVADIAGPQVREAPDLARAYLHAAGRRRPVLPVRLPGRVFRAYRHGGHLAPEHPVGEITFEDYLATQPHPRPGTYRRSRP